MKIRTDFVTNSSSSSFIIAKKNLDNDQLEAIRNHSYLAEKLGLDSPECSWNIEENDKYITGYTIIDNFDMDEFLSIIEIDMNLVNWDEYEFDLDSFKGIVPNNCNDYEEDDEQNWRDLL